MVEKSAVKRPKMPTEDESLDDALMGTFPASDPPAVTTPHSHVGEHRKEDDKDED